MASLRPRHAEACRGYETMFEQERFTALPSPAIAPAGCHALQRRLKLQRALGLKFLVGLSVSALLALAPTAEALELGNARVTSTIGQTLRVEIPYRTHGYERLTAACVSLEPAARGQLPAYTQATTVSTRDGVIAIQGNARVLDPLVGLNLRVACAGVPHIVRSYELFVNPAVTASAAPTPRVAPSVRAQTAIRSPRPRPVPSARSRGDSGASIVPGQTYVVVRGDTLSGIAARIVPRDVALWPAVEQLFAANPDAFDGGDLNRLREGATLSIPLFGASAAATTQPARTEPKPAPVGDRALTEYAASLAAQTAATTTTALDPAATAAGTGEPGTVSQPVEAPLPATVAAAPTPAAAEASPFVQEPAPAASAPEVLSYASDAADSATSDNSAGGAPGWLVAGIAIGAAAVLFLLWLFSARRAPAARDPLAGFDTSAKVRTEPARAPAPVKPAVVAVTPAPTELDLDDFDLSHQYGDNSTFIDSEVEYAPATTQEMSALDHTTPPEDDPLAISAVDLDIGEALAATGIDVGEATATLEDDEPSTVTHVTADPAVEDPSITIAEMDMLARDYEAEFTATQQLSKELADAVADLKRTQAGASNDVVPQDETLLTAAHDVDRTAALDDAETAYLDDPAGTEQSWDERAEETAMALTDEVLRCPEAVLPDATAKLSLDDDAEEGNTVEMPGDDGEPGHTVEMPASDDVDREPWEPSNDAGGDDSSDWPAFREASKRGNAS